MRFQIKKILEGFDPADLIEQSMYCFGSDSSDDTAGEENAIAGELNRSDVTNVSNVSNSSDYDAQFTADNLQDRGLNPSNFMSADNFAQTTQGGASDPYALNDEAYASMSRSANNVAQNLANSVNISASPVAQVARQNIPSYAQQQNLANMSFIPQGALDRNYNVNYTPAVDLTFPERFTNMFSRAYLGENAYNPVPSSISVTEAGKNYSPVAFSPDFTNKEEANSLADLSTNLATNNQAYTLDPTKPYSYDDMIANTRPMNRDEVMIDPNYVVGSSASDVSLGRVPQDPFAKSAEAFGRAILPLGIGNLIPTYDQRQNQLGRDIISGKGSAIYNDDGVITGIDYYDSNDNNSMNNNDNGNDTPQVVRPTQNPVSGQPVCPDGYRYDDDLQACRLDTSSPNMPTNSNPFPSGDAYYRATSLDQAPVNAPSGFDFNSANQNFVNNFAYRPANFTNQMGLSGFTPFRRS